MSFGLVSAPATYVSAMNEIFSGAAYRSGKATAKEPSENPQKRAQRHGNYVKVTSGLAENLLQTCVVIYIDDILVFSNTPEEHVEHVRKVFERLHAYEIYLKADKCFFAKPEVEYLGHRLTKDGVLPNEDKVDAVSKWPRPQTVSDVRQFLGLCGYYRKFMKGYSQIACPLTDLTKTDMSDAKGNIHNWTDACNVAFEKLKELLTTAPVLALPDTVRGKFHIQCDASTYGLGATLFQEGAEDKKFHPCAFISRVLKPQERKDFVSGKKRIYELELRALAWALEKWRMYLEGQLGTTVETDHKSLIWLQTQKDLTPSQAEFLDVLARNDLQVKYLKGDKNIVADALSRHPEYKKWFDKIDLEYEEMLKRWGSGMQRAKAASAALVTSERPKYVHLDAFLQRVEEGYKTDPKYKDKEERKPFELIDNEGRKLWYKVTDDDEDPPRLCIPNDEGLRTQLIKEFHEPRTIGHRQGDDGYNKMRLSFWWQGMRSEVTKYTRACKVCNRSKRDPTGTTHGEMMEEPQVPMRPWESVAMDFCGEFHTCPKTGFNQVLVVVCRLTKMAHFIPCKTTMSAEEVADLFISEVIKHHGLAADYRSDLDKIFRSEFWDHIWSKLGTTLSIGTAYRHETAGQAERAIQELKKYMKIYATEHQEWVQHIPFAEFAFNSAVNSATGCTPFELNKGFRPTDPTQALSLELSGVKRRKKDPSLTWLSSLQSKLELARDHLVRAHEDMKQSYDQRHRPTKHTDGTTTFAPKGSRVYLSTADLKNVTTLSKDAGGGMVGPIEPKWLPVYLGPFEVLEECGNNNLNRRLKLTATLKQRLASDVFHVSKLKTCLEDGSTVDLSRTIPPPVLTENGEQTYYVERIIGHTDEGRKGRSFKVQGVGYHDEEDYWWVHENDMENARERMKTYFEGTPRLIVATRRQAADKSQKRIKVKDRAPARANYVQGCGAPVRYSGWSDETDISNNDD
jgi:hypothetical protein